MGNTCDVTEQQPERRLCATVESNFLQTFGVRPARAVISRLKTMRAAPVPSDINDLEHP